MTAMVFANLDASSNRNLIEMIATYLRGRQNANGSWDYSNRTQGDTSISQYAVLGLWEARKRGGRRFAVGLGPCGPMVHVGAKRRWKLELPPRWGVPRNPLDDRCGRRQPDDLPATTGSLPPVQSAAPARSWLRSCPRATHEGYHPSTSNTQIDQAITRGLAWIAANFAPKNTAIIGQSPYYGLYGIERIGALADRQTIGRVDWFAKGRDFIQSTQRADGSWQGAHGTEMNTVWAILFLTKSTAKTIRRITIHPKLGAGTLLGGRELPKDLTSMTVAGGRVVSRPMNGAIEGMLAVLEDPRAEQADAAVAGLVERYYVEGAGRAASVQGPLSQDAVRPRPGRAPGCRLGAGPYGRSRCRPGPDRRHGRSQRRRRRGDGDPPGAPALEPQDQRDGPADPLVPGRASRRGAAVARVVSGDPAAGPGGTG